MAPAEKQKGSLLERLAAESGLAVVVVDPSAAEVAAANNNSICGALYPSPDLGRACAEYCGKAYERASAAGGPIEYQCHAGLFCRAVPLAEHSKQFVAILGRTFTSAEDYREATDKAVNGAWRRFSPATLFENVILSSSPVQIDRLVSRIAELDEPLIEEPAAGKPKRGRTRPPEAEAAAPPPVEDAPVLELPEPVETADDPLESSLLNYKLGTEQRGPDPFETSMVNARLELSGSPENEDMADREAWRAFIPSLLKVPYRLACQRILGFLARHYGIPSSLWLQREGNHFEMAAVLGELADSPVRIEISVDDRRILAAVRDDSPIVLRELQTAGNRKPRVIQLFPVVIGGEVRNALGIGREEIDPNLSGRILKFCRYVASRLEILRLRDAVAQQEYVSQVLRDFNDQLRDVDADNFWERLITVSARLIAAERASLLVRGTSAGLSAKASVGSGVDLSTYPDLGSRVARTILEKGKPVLVADTDKAALSPAEPGRNYRSKSFISYPLTLGGAGIGVMNFTDKSGGDQFSKRDLEALDTIAPQIAVVLDRILLREKVSEFAQLSVTDPLTGLLNRRYIEERLAEEMNRSGRTGEPLSFLMIDVDQFKSYNDRFGHPAGDEALRLVGSILRENLRGADVAVRYGGEEFSVLLPATNSDEAMAIAERIRKHVDVTAFPRRKVTVSIGVASISDRLQSVSSLIDAADRALFRAKEGGRNTVKVYTPDLDDGEILH